MQRFHGNSGFASRSDSQSSRLEGWHWQGMALLLDERSVVHCSRKGGGAELRSSQTDGWRGRRRRSLSGLLTATGTVVGRLPEPGPTVYAGGDRRHACEPLGPAHRARRYATLTSPTRRQLSSFNTQQYLLGLVKKRRSTVPAPLTPRRILVFLVSTSKADIFVYLQQKLEDAFEVDRI